MKFPDAESARFFRDEWRDGGLELDGHRLRIDFTRDARSEGDSWICDNVRFEFKIVTRQLEADAS